MIVQCAWCMRLLGEKAPYSNKDVTHSICQECETKLRKDIEKIHPSISPSIKEAV